MWEGYHNRGACCTLVVYVGSWGCSCCLRDQEREVDGIIRGGWQASAAGACASMSGVYM